MANVLKIRKPDGEMDVEATIKNILQALKKELNFDNIKYFNQNLINGRHLQIKHDPGAGVSGELILDNYWLI